MIANFNVYLRDRITGKVGVLYVTRTGIDDIQAAAHDLLIELSDADYKVFRVVLLSISNFTL